MDYIRKPLPFRRIRQTLSAPFIYSVFLGFICLDVLLELYHRTSFPLYGLPYVKRRDYIRIDRHRLKYLSIRQKFNCAYCGYANGLIAYAQEIAGRTEQYWCGIKHKNDPGRLFYAPDYQKDFIPYGDEEKYRDFAKKKR